MNRKKRTHDEDEDNGFAQWGGYMEAKKAKLMEQFSKNTAGQAIKLSDIFKSVSIFVNGLTHPTADELKKLMASHGGTYHHYQVAWTTHIIASNLPNVKIKNQGNVPIVKPEWITDSIEAEKLLDYRKYLLYTNKSTTQPQLNFKPESKSLTASDPRFLTEFYNNSRLHLISTLGAELKQMVADWRNKSDHSFPGREKLVNDLGVKDKTFGLLTESVVMHIDMDCFFVSVGVRNRPELKGKPVAVTHARTGQVSSNRQGVDRNAEIALYKERLPSGVTTRLDLIDENSSMSEIASCSYEARKCGVRNGMFMGTALKMCPDLKTIPYDFEDYRKVSLQLYNIIASYTLDIEAVSCDEMYVDITTILQETGMSVDEWATHIRKEITEATGCPCSTGFGANRLQARVATKKAKPSGQFHLRQDGVEEYMAQISLADLPGVGYATVAKLKELGFLYCGDIQKGSVSLLQNKLGRKIGTTIYEQANGIDNKPLNFQHERKSVSTEVNYGIRFKSQEECTNFLKDLSVEVHARLAETGKRAKTVTLKLMVRAKDAPEETAKFLGHGICDSLSKSSTSRLISNANEIYEEVKQLYDRFDVPFGDLRGIGIQLTKLEKVPVVNKAIIAFLNTANTTTTTSDVKNESSKKPLSISSNTTVQNKSKETKQTKRGRPPKNSIQKSTVNLLSSDGLEKYFKKDKSSLSKPFVQEKLNSAEIDLKVLNELPPDLQHEIITEYNLNVKTKADVPAKKEIKEKNAFEKLDQEEFKSMLKEWLQTVDSPTDFDVNMLGGYLKQLALDRKIEVLNVILNFLYRHMSVRDCGPWHKAYFALINQAQKGMVARYGSTLFVKGLLKCCNNV